MRRVDRVVDSVVPWDGYTAGRVAAKLEGRLPDRKADIVVAIYLQST
jgi:hypothetical protein